MIGRTIYQKPEKVITQYIKDTLYIQGPERYRLIDRIKYQPLEVKSIQPVVLNMPVEEIPRVYKVKRENNLLTLTLVDSQLQYAIKHKDFTLFLYPQIKLYQKREFPLKWGGRWLCYEYKQGIYLKTHFDILGFRIYFMVNQNIFRCGLSFRVF